MAETPGLAQPFVGLWAWVGGCLSDRELMSSLGFSRERGHIKMPLPGDGTLGLTSVLRKHSFSTGKPGPCSAPGNEIFSIRPLLPGLSKSHLFYCLEQMNSDVGE